MIVFLKALSGSFQDLLLFDVVCFPEEGAVMGLGGQGPEKLADASGSKRIRVCP